MAGIKYIETRILIPCNVAKEGSSPLSVPPAVIIPPASDTGGPQLGPPGTWDDGAHVRNLITQTRPSGYDNQRGSHLPRVRFGRSVKHQGIILNAT